ncbi:MAG: hypothetical protein AB7O80_12890 [Acetobacteraceae bacterium]
MTHCASDLEAITLGAMVCLNSGGPPMEVVSCDAAIVTAEWLDDDGQRQQMTLPAVCIRAIEPLMAEG